MRLPSLKLKHKKRNKLLPKTVKRKVKLKKPKSKSQRQPIRMKVKRTLPWKKKMMQVNKPLKMRV